MYILGTIFVILIGFFCVVINPINSVSGGLDNICYNYRPGDIYYETYPEQLTQTRTEALVLEKYVETYRDDYLYSISYHTDYFVTLSIDYRDVVYKVVKNISQDKFNKIIKGETVPVNVITTNCFETTKSLIKNSKDTIYFEVNNL